MADSEYLDPLETNRAMRATGDSMRETINQTKAVLQETRRLLKRLGQTCPSDEEAISQDRVP